MNSKPDDEEEETAESVVQLTLENRLDELDLSELQLSSWPKLSSNHSIFSILPRITIMDLSCNPLQKVGYRMGSFDTEKTNIPKVPVEVEQWEKLEEFSADSCNFQVFPKYHCTTYRYGPVIGSNFAGVYWYSTI